MDSYSAFFDETGRTSTGLHAYLQKKQIHTLHFVGLATNYCVLKSVLDAARLGYAVTVVANGCRGVGDVGPAFQAMKMKGVEVI